MGDDSISFTRHAEEMLAERNIERAWVERTIRDPEEVENDERPGAVRAYRAIPERDGRVLRVVYSKSSDEIRVITAFFDRAKRR